MNQQHTPTPWRVGNPDGTGIVPQNAAIPWIANLDNFDNPKYQAEQKANAAFIVQAVNSHTALEKVDGCAPLVLHAWDASAPNETLHVFMDQLRAALKLIERAA